MSVFTVDLKKCADIYPNKKEILRYMGCPNTSEELDGLIASCIGECTDAFKYGVCYTEVPVCIDGDSVDFGAVNVTSRSLAKNLSGCDGAVIFGATVGLEIDRLIAKYGRISPSRAVVLQALGAERVEALCDAFCRELEHNYGRIRPRFSPGYGDLPLSFQQDIFSLLDCPRRIGLTLNGSLLMSPSKSVTAVVGKISSNTDE